MRRVLIAAGITVALVGSVVVYLNEPAQFASTLRELSGTGGESSPFASRSVAAVKEAAIRSKQHTRYALFIGAGVLLVVVGVAWPRPGGKPPAGESASSQPPGPESGIG